MRMFKKYLSIMLLVGVVMLSACGGQEATQQENSSTETGDNGQAVAGQSSAAGGDVSDTVVTGSSEEGTESAEVGNDEAGSTDADSTYIEIDWSFDTSGFCDTSKQWLEFINELIVVSPNIEEWKTDEAWENLANRFGKNFNTSSEDYATINASYIDEERDVRNVCGRYDFVHSLDNLRPHIPKHTIYDMRAYVDKLTEEEATQMRADAVACLTELQQKDSDFVVTVLEDEADTYKAKIYAEKENGWKLEVSFRIGFRHSYTGTSGTASLRLTQEHPDLFERAEDLIGTEYGMPQYDLTQAEVTKEPGAKSDYFWYIYTIDNKVVREEKINNPSFVTEDIEKYYHVLDYYVYEYDENGVMTKCYYGEEDRVRPYGYMTYEYYDNGEYKQTMFYRIENKKNSELAIKRDYDDFGRLVYLERYEYPLAYYVYEHEETGEYKITIYQKNNDTVDWVYYYYANNQCARKIYYGGGEYPGYEYSYYENGELKNETQYDGKGGTNYSKNYNEDGSVAGSTGSAGGQG